MDKSRDVVVGGGDEENGEVGKVKDSEKKEIEEDNQNQEKVLLNNEIIVENKNKSESNYTINNNNYDGIKNILNKDGWVEVIVDLKNNQYTVPEFRNDNKKKSEVKKMIDSVRV